MADNTKFYLALNVKTKFINPYNNMLPKRKVLKSIQFFKRSDVKRKCFRHFL